MESGEYVTGRELGEAEWFRLYQCSFPDGTVGILKLALDIVGDGLLDREALILSVMREEAERREQAFIKAKGDSNEYLNYPILFPNLVESFIAEEQDGRRINIVNFPAVPDDLGRLVPLEDFRLRARVRVDSRSSAWMMGKLLKLLAFAHDQGIAVGQVTGSNILIESNQHYVTVFDWTGARNNFDGAIPAELARGEISQAAREIILALGGDPDTGTLPGDDLVEGRYHAFLFNLASGGYRDASQAHAEFYQLIRSLWPREFYSFTTYALD